MLLESVCMCMCMCMYRNIGVYKSVHAHGRDQGSRVCMGIWEEKKREKRERESKRKEKGAVKAGVSGLSEL